LELSILFCVSVAHAQVTGSGTKNTIPVWTGTNTLGNSKIFQIGGNVGVNVNTPGAQLDVESASTTKPAVIGNNFATTGTTTGVQGGISSPHGFAVSGFARATIGNAAGGLFQTASGLGTGLIGANSATTGTAIGVYGQTSSSGGQGVNGTSVATAGSGIGVVGLTKADNGVGVSAHATSTTGFPQAFYGDTNASTGVVALLRSQAGSDIITGQFGVGFSAVNVFRVDHTGKGFFDGGTQTGGADFAESMAVAKGQDRQEPGDVLVVDITAKRQLKLGIEPYSTLVAGIYSTKPGVLATPHKMDETAANEIPLAIVGIVPCKVSAENGPIQPGDLLVTSSTPGHAMKGTDRSKMLGAVVGKALEPLSGGKGVIQVLVTLQ
jgi:hypothetical protein